MMARSIAPFLFVTALGLPAAAQPDEVEEVRAAQVAAAVGSDPAVPNKKKQRETRKKDSVEVSQQGDRAAFSGARVGLDSTFEASGGYLHGEGVRRVDAAVVKVGGAVAPKATAGPFAIELPISASHRETLGAELRETRGRLGVGIDLKPFEELRFGLDGDLSLTYRPGWPDLYQPLDPNGDGIPEDLASSDRNSFWQGRIGASATARPLKRLFVRARYRYSVVDYREDPDFNAVDEPNHLAPSDHTRHQEEVSIKYVARDWKAGVSFEASQRHDSFKYARDAGTGATHASPGGASPNPLQELRTYVPAIGGSVDLLDDRLEVSLSYGYEIMQDTFEGYYSYRGHRPEIDVQLGTPVGVNVEAGVALIWRTYGPNSYAEGGSHPALEFGDRRVDHRVRLTAGATYPLKKGLTVVFEARWLRRRTNFPNYVPGVYPSQRLYDVEWSYDNVETVAGLRYEM